MNTQGMIPLKENDSKKISDRYQKKTYAKGATCIYGDTLYRAKADITTAEEWTAAHWEETNMETIRAEMAAEVSSLNASMNKVCYQQEGEVTLKGQSARWAYAHVIFPKPYKSTPLVTANAPAVTNIASSGSYYPLIQSISNTGFTIGLYNITDSPTYRWQAIGVLA